MPLDPSKYPQHIFGMHDPGAEQIFSDAGKRAWIVVTVLTNRSDSDGNFSNLANYGHAPIVRLNNGYGSDGTLPFSSLYDAFAKQCADFVANSQGAHIWIIGNETNLRGERPGNSDSNPGESITPDKYALCFAKCRAAIKNVAGHADDWVIPAPPGPWNVETTYGGNPNGDWVLYFRDLLNQCLSRGAPPDALALHTYTHDASGQHGHNAAFIAIEDKFQDPRFNTRHYQFRAYQDFLSIVPNALRNRPVLITESQGLPWDNVNNGWIQNAFAEVNSWNTNPANQPIQALCLFRWQASGDPGWSLSNRPQLTNDLRAALQNDFQVRFQAQAVATPPTRPAAPAPLSTPTTTGGGPGRVTLPLQIYVIQFGDNLSSIAKKFGVTVQAILDATKAQAATDATFTAIPNASLIRPGQKLVIPTNT